MAKFLTLNTHSWLEANSLKKLFDLAENIYIENYDVICLQEINQDIRGLAAKDVEGYEKLPGSPELHCDNYALQLVNYLRSQGRHYYWSWAYNHIGYDKYNEGVVILSKNPIKVKDILVSAVDDEHDYHTRRDTAGYDMILNSPLELQDSHKVAKSIQGDHTIIEDIDGWEGNKQSLKVDHVFTSKEIEIQSSTVVFDGGESPIVSDHFGLAVDLNY